MISKNSIHFHKLYYQYILVGSNYKIDEGDSEYSHEFIHYSILISLNKSDYNHIFKRFYYNIVLMDNLGIYVKFHWKMNIVYMFYCTRI